VNALRVGLFSECYRPIQNGIVASVDASARALRERRHEAVIVTPRMPAYRDEDPGVVRAASLPLPLPTAYRLTLPYLPRGIGALSIVHTHSPFITGALGALYARRAHVPLVFTYHTQLEAYAHYVPFEARAMRGGALLLTRTYASVADAVIVPTRAMERRLRALGVRGRIAVVPSGIDVAAFACGRRSDELRARFGVAPHEKMLLAVGRLGREKNVELILAAFARMRLPQVRLVIVGDGAHRPELERQAHALGIGSRTTFAREYARSALPDAYACADAFVFTSRSETQGLVLVEALAAGIPIVALDTPPTREVLADAGTLVSDDAQALAAALERVLASPVGLGLRGRAVAKNYDGAAVGARLMDLYAEVIERRAKRPTSFAVVRPG
jgi:1,2-diacylglycerol 3-alpha-glucosyltransferase